MADCWPRVGFRQGSISKKVMDMFKAFNKDLTDRK
jgi:hypothetical protein